MTVALLVLVWLLNCLSPSSFPSPVEDPARGRRLPPVLRQPGKGLLSLEGGGVISGVSYASQAGATPAPATFPDRRLGSVLTFTSTTGRWAVGGDTSSADTMVE